MTTVARDMSQRWNDFAKRDPFHFVATSRRDWTTTDFFDSGRDTVQTICEWIGDQVQRHTMLEIGCGPGRTLVHFAGCFDRAFGIDVSREMLQLAAARRMPENVELVLGTGGDLAPFEADSFDVVYCGLVMQHIPSSDVISNYMREVERVLRNEGRAVLQFDTRPESRLASLYKMLPDPMLPRDHRRYIRRYRRDPHWLRIQFRRAGLVILDERQERSAEHYFMLARQGKVPTDHE